jgi:adenine-specific DNA-methyltransferase
LASIKLTPYAFGDALVVVEHNPGALTGNGHQFELGNPLAIAENPDYLSRQLITYIGNKRTLLGQIGKEWLSIFDPFSGSGIVSRFLKAHSELLICNDLEDYASLIGRCYLSNKSSVDLIALAEITDELNARVEAEPFQGVGFIEELYSPQDEKNITKDDRVFYTRKNARRLDNYRHLIDDYPANFRDLLLGPLLSEASVHSNTAGVFKGFYKNRSTGIGQYGGTGSDALTRIKGEIKLAPPVLSNFKSEYRVLQGDANTVARQVKGLDLAYIDPPYNQHPYGSNYFMLNLLVNYQRPENISRVSGIPMVWRRSGYNVRAKSSILFRELLESIDAPFLLISFNNEGFISLHDMCFILQGIGTFDNLEIPYNTFRGSRNLRNRPIHVTEYLFLVERR